MTVWVAQTELAQGLKDINRPAEKLSISQNLALAMTGFIWVRPAALLAAPGWHRDYEADT